MPKNIKTKDPKKFSVAAPRQYPGRTFKEVLSWLHGNWGYLCEQHMYTKRQKGV